MNYITSTYILDLLPNTTKVINNSTSVRNATEKLFTFNFKEFMPPTIVTKNISDIEKFLDSFKEIKICVGYKLNNKKIDYFPLSEIDQRNIKPIYETHEGWLQTTQGARTWSDLPALAIKYVRRIEELLDTQVSILSTSPKREDTILVKNPFIG